MESPATILVVDDEPNVRYFLQEMLRHDGHNVVAVESAETALEKIAVQEFDLALIDLKLKGMGGVELLAILREKWPQTTAIMLTAYATVDTAIEALRKGAYDYLEKPFKTITLRESVKQGLLKHEQERQQRELLNQVEHRLVTALQEIRTTVGNGGKSCPNRKRIVKEERTEAPLRVGDLCVDFSRHLITLDGYPLKLSSTEFGLLAYLAQKSPGVIEPQELLHETQGYRCNPQEASRLVRYHIYRIRQKIRELPTAKDIIRTVRGVGYTIQQ